MGIVIALSVMVLLLIVLVAVLVKEGKPFKAFLSGVLGFVFFIILVGGFAPYELGQGRVPDEAEDLAKRLDAGVMYQVLSSSKNGDGHILLVKKAEKSDLYALRVKTIPPEHFVLVDGKPVAIVAPAPPTDAK